MSNEPPGFSPERRPEQGGRVLEARLKRRAPLYAELQGFAAYDRLKSQGFFSLDLEHERDSRILDFAYIRCQATADLLQEELTHIERYQSSRYPTLHLQGDLGERAVIYQWEGIGQVENANNPDVQHGNNANIDIIVESPENDISFAADSKVSLSDSWEYYYLRKLEDFDQKVRDGTLPDNSARLFVPDDQVPALKEAVDRHFERKAKSDPSNAETYHDAAIVWKERVSGSPLSSDIYAFVIDNSRIDGNAYFTDIAKLKGLYADLRSAAEYLKNRTVT